MSPKGDRRRTAAWRLALPGILVLATGSAAVMSVGYWMLSDSVRSRGDAWLEAEVESVAERVEVAGSSLTAAELEPEVRELELHEGLRSGEEQDEGDGFFVLAVLAPGGRVSASAVRGARSALNQVLTALPSSERSTSWVQPGGWEYPVRVVSQRLPDGRRIVGGATPWADAELLEEIRDVALAGWVVMLLVGVPAAWIEVRRVLARVDRLSDVAATISADALARRLPQRRGDHGGDEIDRLAATLNALLDRAGGAVEQLRTLADAMAHDLRTPLAAIRGTLENAVTVDDDGARRATVEAAIAEVDDLAALVSATLDTAEAEAGALRLRRVPLDLAGLVRDLAELYEPAAADHGLKLVVDVAGPVEVEADEALLKRVLINLLDNAIAHLPAGTRVTVTARVEAGRAVLAVADDGPGFPAEMRTRAFDRLVRGPGSKGRGLGLAMVRAVALAHGGRAVLEHPSDGGSAIRVELPI